jgi:hypothetical protein
MRDGDAGFAAARPRCAHDGLRSLVHDFAALVSFVLNTPLANLLAKVKARKLAATSNAVCHE